MHFLINNLAPSDLNDRVELIRKAVFPEFKDWFANYLVVKRAAQVCSLLVLNLNPTRTFHAMPRNAHAEAVVWDTSLSWRHACRCAEEP